MLHDPTASYGSQEGIALARKASESGDWKPVADWLAKHPLHAVELAEFLAQQRGLRPSVTALPDSAFTGISIGDLELREEIGRGGMGTVYRAFDPTLRREVAVKLLRPTGDMSRADRAKFQFEAEAAASLDHPHIVKVFTSGEQNGVPFLSMPMLVGGSLAQRLKNAGPSNAISPVEAAELVRDIAHGVHHAHRRGLIHRDLKPGNILLDEAGRPYVADFGLARSLDVNASGTGGIAGTAAYMSPEQARGEKGLTTAVDVWALGAILFELLSGRPPFGTGEWLSVLKQVQEDPTPTLNRLRPGVPPDLEAICRKCLEKRPRDRYRSAEELADDLVRFLHEEPVEARPRGVLADLGGALNWKRQTASMNTWLSFIIGSGTQYLFHGAAAFLLFHDHDRWVYVLFTAHFALWIFTLWWQGIRHKDELNAVERAGLALQIGMLAAASSLFAAYCLRPDLDIATLYLGFNIIGGLGLFVRGLTDWGLHFLFGLVYLGQNLLLPFLPDWAWPALHAIVGGSLFLWIGVHRYRLVRHAPPARTLSSQDTVTN